MGSINYNNANAVAAFKYPIGVPSQPTAFESYYYDEGSKTMRPYKSVSEALTYLNTAQARKGHKPVFIQEGSVLTNNGLTGGEIKEYWFKDGIADDDLVLKNAVLPAVPDWVVLNGPEWNVRKFPKVIIQLTKDVTIVNTENVPKNKLFEAFIKQPAIGGCRLIVDSHEVDLNIIDGKLMGNTSAYFRYINEELDIHTDPSAQSYQPILDTQTYGGIALNGSRTLFHARFLRKGRTLLYRWEKDGTPQKEHTGASIYMEGIPENVGSWECVAIDSITKLETRSEPMPFNLGDPKKVYVILGPTDLDINAGEPFTLSAKFGGTPIPDVVLIEVTGTDNDGKPTGPVVGTGSTFKGMAYNTTRYAFKGTNTILEQVETKAAVRDANGFIETPAEYEYQEKTYSAFTDVITVKPKKQDKAAPTVTMDDDAVQSTLNVTPGSGEASSLFEGTLDATAQTPGLASVNNFKLLVGDVNLPAGNAGIRYKETQTHYASPWATNMAAFTGTLIAAPTNLQIDVNKYELSWTKSVDALPTPTEEYRINGGAWVDTSESKAPLTENIPVGGFEAREKARPGKPASASLTNTEAINLPAYFITGTLKTLNDTARDYYHDENTPDKIKSSDDLAVIVITSGPNPGVFNTKDVQENWQSTGKNIFQAAKGVSGSDIGPGAGQVVNGMGYKLVRSSSSGNDFSGKNLCTYGPDGVYFYDKQSPVNLTKALNALVKVGYSLSGRKREDLYRCTQAVNTYGINVMQLESYQGSPALPADLYGATWEIVNP